MKTWFQQFFLSQIQLVPLTPRFVALTALSHVAGCDAASGAAYAERMLPQLPTLLAARDPQVHAAVLRALSRCLPGLAEVGLHSLPGGVRLVLHGPYRVSSLGP